MIDEQRLRDGLQRLLRDTETAIRERISDEPSIEAQLRERHAAAVRAGRTVGSSAGYNSFTDEAITQSAVHWLLSVFWKITAGSTNVAREANQRRLPGSLELPGTPRIYRTTLPVSMLRKPIGLSFCARTRN